MHSFLTYNDLRTGFLAPKARFVDKINEAYQEEYGKFREYGKCKLRYLVVHTAFEFDGRPIYHEVLICENEGGETQYRFVTGTNIPAIMGEAATMLLGEMPQSQLFNFDEFKKRLEEEYKNYEIDEFPEV